MLRSRTPTPVSIGGDRRFPPGRAGVCVIVMFHIVISRSILWNKEEGDVMGRTLAEKVWERHVVHRADGEPDLLYVDLHLVHEVTSPQAFDGLRAAGRPVRRPDLTVATMDHNVPTAPGPQDPISVRQMEALSHNCAEFGLTL